MNENKLKIVIANKYLYPRGGDCLYTLRLMELLEKAGHTVIPFSMHHPENIKTDYDRYFVKHIDFREELKRFGIKNSIEVASRAIVNSEAAFLMSKLIDECQPDLVHLNNIHHQLTPEIIKAPARYNIPIVWTHHDYTLFCPDHVFLRDGKVCKKCINGQNIHAVINRCKKGSLGASLIAALECWYHNPRKLARQVDRFITPSKFLADIMLNHGIPEAQVTHFPNFLPSAEIDSTGNDYFLYFGRLSSEKGVNILLEAFKNLNQGKLIVAGDGPELDNLKSKAGKLGVRGVDFIGHQSPDSIIKLLSGCIAGLVPSICLENFPYTVMETMIASKPVIASRIGGIPEQVEHDDTGLLFEPGNVDDLRLCLEKILTHKSMAAEMGRRGKLKALREYTAVQHYKNIMKVYEEVIDNKRNVEFKESRESISVK
ncbi:MAG: glycosyltransferase family 4 protein [candidate division Zixibacteria bacterium]|nr:glycosyltransferase family 4 protein [candidate division Zixibacteria bacterium]